MRNLVVSIMVLLIGMQFAARIQARRKARVREAQQSLDELIRDLREDDLRAAAQLLQQEKRISREPETHAAWNPPLHSEAAK
ncbi:MAG: hypothetical protein ACE15F_20650 [bacterium]